MDSRIAVPVCAASVAFNRARIIIRRNPAVSARRHPPDDLRVAVALPKTISRAPTSIPKPPEQNYQHDQCHDFPRMPVFSSGLKAEMVWVPFQSPVRRRTISARHGLWADAAENSGTGRAKPFQIRALPKFSNLKKLFFTKSDRWCAGRPGPDPLPRNLKGARRDSLAVQPPYIQDACGTRDRTDRHETCSLCRFQARSLRPRLSRMMQHRVEAITDLQRDRDRNASRDRRSLSARQSAR